MEKLFIDMTHSLRKHNWYWIAKIQDSNNNERMRVCSNKHWIELQKWNNETSSKKKLNEWKRSRSVPEERIAVVVRRRETEIAVRERVCARCESQWGWNRVMSENGIIKLFSGQNCQYIFYPTSQYGFLNMSHDDGARRVESSRARIKIEFRIYVSKMNYF